MKKLFFLAFVAVATNLPAQTQDLLANPYSNPLWLNPAYTGGGLGPTLNGTYNLLYYSNSSPFRSTLIAAEIPVDKLSSGFGILLEDSRSTLGYQDLVQGSAYLTYAYSFKICEDLTIRPGVRGGLWRSNSPLDIYTQNGTIVRPGFGSGIIISGHRFSAGISTDHLYFSKSDISTYLVPSSYNIQAAYSFGDADFSISPAILFQNSLGGYNLETDLHVKYSKLYAIIGQRNLMAAILGAGIHFDHVRLNYCFRADYSALNYQQTHEVGLSFVLAEKTERTKLKGIHNPVYLPVQ